MENPIYLAPAVKGLKYIQSVIWADTDIRLMVKTTAQSVIWADTDIRLMVKTTAQSVIIKT